MTTVREHGRRSRRTGRVSRVRRHERHASIREVGNDVVITIDKQDFDREMKRAGVLGRRIMNAEMRRMGF